MNTGEPNLRRLYWSAAPFLFLLPFFVSRIAWGKENSFIVLPLGWLQVGVASLGIIASARQTERFKTVAIFFTSLLLLIHGVHAIYLTDIWGGDWGRYVLKGLVLWGYLTVSLVFAVSLSSERAWQLLRVFRLYGLITVAVGVVSLAVLAVTGFAFQLHHEDYGWYRVQAFMSEPSALAPVVAFLCCLGLWRGDRFALMAGLTGCALTFSPIVLLVSVLTQISVLLIKVRASRVYLVAAFVFFVIVVFIADCGAVDPYKVNPLINLFGRLICGVQTVFLADARGVFINHRLESTMVVFGHVAKMHAWWSGLGINSTSIFMGQLYGDVRDNALWVSLGAYYGVWGLLGFLVVGFLGFCGVRRGDEMLGFAWLAFFWAVSLNSAQGFYTYSLYFVVWILLMKSFPFGRGRGGRGPLGAVSNVRH